MIVTPPKDRAVTRHMARSNTFLPVLKYSYDESTGVKVLHVLVTMPSSCLRGSVLPTITKNGMEVELTYSWEMHVFDMFQRCSNDHGIPALTSQQNAVRELLQTFGDPITHTNSSKMTIDLPFRCESQFYIDPGTNYSMNGERHRGYEIRAKRIDQNRVMYLMMMQLCAVRDNYAHYRSAPINERFVDEDGRQEFVMQQQQPPTPTPYIPPIQTNVPHPVPPNDQQNLRHPPTPGVVNLGQQTQEMDLENLAQNEELSQFMHETLTNQNLAVNTDIHRTILQNADIPDVSQMIQALNLQNPEFIDILKKNSTIPATVKDDENKKAAEEDDTTVPDEVQSSLSQRVIFHALAKMFKNNNSLN